jgi:hypothetical protein
MGIHGLELEVATRVIRMSVGIDHNDRLAGERLYQFAQPGDPQTGINEQGISLPSTRYMLS